MKHTGIRWLYSELPRLVERGVISMDTGERLREFYGPAPERSSPMRVVVIMLSVLGAGLIGAGIILLLAHNWMELPRSARTVLSFLPLAVGQILVGWTLLRHRASRPWCEGSGTFLTASVGASIALIAQTYNLPGNLTNFLFVWMLLAAPLIYLLDSVTVWALYLVGLAAWAGFIQDQGGHALMYWPLLAVVLPAMYRHFKRDPASPRSQLMAWILGLHGCVAMGLVLERCLPGIWIVVYTAYFVTLIFVAERYLGEEGQVHPFALIGRVGSVILGLVLTYEDVWRGIGFHYYRWQYSYHPWAAVQDYAIAVGLLSAVCLLGWTLYGQDRKYTVLWAGFPLLGLAGYLAVSAEWPEELSMTGFNLYLLAMGIVSLWQGLAQRRLLVINGGMGMLTLLFVARFFDVDLTFTMRGIVFIVLGTGFLVTNILVSRKIVRTGEDPS